MFSYYIDTLALRDLVNELCVMKDIWSELGVQLNVPEFELRSIQMHHNNNPSRCLQDMLSEWLSITSPPPTWQTVMDALNSKAISRPLVAQKIYMKYCSQDIGIYAFYALF